MVFGKPRNEGPVRGSKGTFADAYKECCGKLSVQCNTAILQDGKLRIDLDNVTDYRTKAVVQALTMARWLLAHTVRLSAIRAKRRAARGDVLDPSAVVKLLKALEPHLLRLEYRPDRDKPPPAPPPPREPSPGKYRHKTQAPPSAPHSGREPSPGKHRQKPQAPPPAPPPPPPLEVHVLHLPGLQLPPHAVTHLARGIVNSAISDLSLKDSCIGDDAFAHLAPALSKMTSLTSLNLSGCQIADRSGGLLTSVIRSHRNHYESQLFSNSLRSQRSEKATGLREINLDHNFFGKSTCKMLVEALYDDRCVTVLRLAHNGICAKAIPFLQKLVKHNETIELLDVSSNECAAGLLQGGQFHSGNGEQCIFTRRPPHTSEAVGVSDLLTLQTEPTRTTSAGGGQLTRTSERNRETEHDKLPSKRQLLAVFDCINTNDVQYVSCDALVDAIYKTSDILHMEKHDAQQLASLLRTAATDNTLTRETYYEVLQTFRPPAESLEQTLQQYPYSLDHADEQERGDTNDKESVQSYPHHPGLFYAHHTMWPGHLYPYPYVPPHYVFTCDHHRNPQRPMNASSAHQASPPPARAQPVGYHEHVPLRSAELRTTPSPTGHPMHEIPNFTHSPAMESSDRWEARLQAMEEMQEKQNKQTAKLLQKIQEQEECQMQPEEQIQELLGVVRRQAEEAEREKLDKAHREGLRMVERALVEKLEALKSKISQDCEEEGDIPAVLGVDDHPEHGDIHERLLQAERVFVGGDDDEREAVRLRVQERFS